MYVISQPDRKGDTHEIKMFTINQKLYAIKTWYILNRFCFSLIVVLCYTIFLKEKNRTCITVGQVFEMQIQHGTM